MEYKTTHPEVTEWSQTDITQNAAELAARELFDEADNDSMYHRSVNAVRTDLATGRFAREPYEIAERILAWSGAL